MPICLPVTRVYTTTKELQLKKGEDNRPERMKNYEVRSEWNFIDVSARAQIDEIALGFMPIFEAGRTNIAEDRIEVVLYTKLYTK